MLTEKQSAQPPLPITPELKAALARFWSLYDERRSEIEAGMLASAARMPDIMEALKRIPQSTEEEKARNREYQRLAMQEGNWKPLLDDLHEQGSRYAQLGVPFKAWLQLLSVFRSAARAQVFKRAEGEEDILEAMNVFIDSTMAALGEAYLATKERLIAQQQDALRELSTPVLQVHDRLLIIPLIGVVDTRRARHLTDSMLRGIRERRARVVVMDITGVPIVDSKVANHLAQACEAARLMGARVILTGVSAAIAQAMVALGAELTGVETLGDLQTGIEEAERHLGLRLSSLPSAPAPATTVQGS